MFTYLGSNILHTQSEVNIHMDCNWYLISDKKNWEFFQALTMSVLLYNRTTSTLTKCSEKKLDGDYTRMLHALLNKSWKLQPRKQQLYTHLLPISLANQVRTRRHAGHCWKSVNKLLSNIFLWTPTHGHTSVGRAAKTYISSVQTLNTM